MAQNRKMSVPNNLIEFIQVTMEVFTRAKVTQHAAMMAYYTLLALFPMLLVLANIIPLLPIDVNQILDISASILPENISDIVEPILVNYLDSGSGGAITIGVITALWSASALVSNLKIIINEIYGTTDLSRNAIVNRIIAPIIFLAIIGALAVLLFAFIFGETLVLMIENLLNIDLIVLETLFSFRLPILIAALLIVFSLVYQLIPDNKTPYRYAFPGAIVATIGMLALSEIFTLYINNSNNDALSNAAIGSFVALMIYLYFVFIIIFLGAVVNAVVFEVNTDQSMREATMIKNNPEENLKKEEVVVLKRKLTKVYPKVIEDTLVDEEKKGR